MGLGSEMAGSRFIGEYSQNQQLEGQREARLDREKGWAAMQLQQKSQLIQQGRSRAEMALQSCPELSQKAGPL